MTCNITTTPSYTEPPPLYRHDSETASIRSAAPSYVSEAPTYTSRRPSTTTSSRNPQAAASASPPRTGLPSPRYAPGFQSRAHGSLSDLSAHNYNISHWSNIHSNHQSRQYENVARRRANQAQVNTTAILNSLSAVPPPSTSPSASSTTLNDAAGVTASTQSGAGGSGSTGGEGGAPTNPLEDPYLVGEEAAGKARQQRLYREKCLRGQDAVRHEGKTWDFMLSQMADWEERERSWGRYRESVEIGGGSGRRKLLDRMGRRGMRS